MWYPRAEAKRLQTVTFWLLWLFTWDDEIDQSTSELSINFEDANRFREETMEYLRHALGVPTKDIDRFRFDVDPPTNRLIRSLDVIGAELKEAYSKGMIGHGATITLYGC